MTTYEFEGKNTEEAIQNASHELNLPVEDLSIDIVEPGSAGIFGLVGIKKARIKVEKIGEKGEPTANDRTGLQIAHEALENILALIPITTVVNSQKADGTIVLNIEGDKSGLLIGKKGKTLDALQFIVNKIVNKELGKRTRVSIDAENYRERRKELLVQLALRMGDKAKRIKKPVTINPLNPRDRRIIHLTLKQDKGLETKSRGEGLHKKVIIIPKQ